MATFTSMNFDVDLKLARHLILNQLRAYNIKHRSKFGELVIATDSTSWRKGVFEYYKYKRKKSREDNKNEVDWEKVFSIINQVKEELKENFPYKVISAPGAESDDIIAVLTMETQEFGKYENVLILASDKDMLQLQKYNNVYQFSPFTKKFIKPEVDAEVHLFEHIIRGDSGDGIPNILSPDNAFVEGSRQSPISKKKLQLWYESDDLRSVMSDLEYRNYCRNKQLIDFDCIPENVREAIINSYENAYVAPNSKILPYLIANNCRELIKSVGDFNVTK